MRSSRKRSVALAAVLAAVLAGTGAGVGSAGAASDQPPGSIAIPTITGLQVGQTLSVSSGTWAGSTPMSFYYQWNRSTATGWTPIPGATGTTYTVTPADIGHNLFVQVKAANAAGHAWANSLATSAVTGPTAADTIALPGGGTSVPVGRVTLPDRLVIQSATFAPATLKAGGTVVATIHVQDSLGNAVRGALVKAVGLPFGAVKPSQEKATNTDGSVRITLDGTAQLANVHAQAIALFVRARQPGQNPLGGVTAQRLVKLPLGG